MFRRRIDQFSRTFRTHRGELFRAEVGSPNSYPRPRREFQNLPHVALVTSRRALAREGDLVTGSGTSYLLAGQHVLSDTKRFLAAECNTRLSWIEQVIDIDPVTELEKERRPVTRDTDVPMVIEPLRSFEELNISRDQYRIITHLPINRGDELGKYTVLSVVDLFGLKVAEVA